MNKHNCQDLIHIFNVCFKKTYNTQLIGGADEPLYIPANNNQSYNAIIFTRDYFRSALHECAHWFIAGPERRQQIDYGYWYEPDGRSPEQQLRFQQAEVKPQALECILAHAAKHTFSISIDNLNQPESDSIFFAKAVQRQVFNYLQNKLPARARQFREALIDFYG